MFKTRLTLLPATLFPKGATVHVLDRGGDNFEVYCHLLQQRSGWVVRASKLNRYVLAGESEERMKLSDYLPQLKLLGSYTLSLRARPQQPAREAQLEVRVGRIKVPPPHHLSPWLRKLKQPPIAMNVVEVVEVNAPEGVTPIRWVLFTSLPVDTFEDAWGVITYYEARWLIEEYHKALKTGCRAESRQLKTAGRLEAFVGLTSVVAVRLAIIAPTSFHTVKNFRGVRPKARYGSPDSEPDDPSPVWNARQ